MKLITNIVLTLALFTVGLSHAGSHAFQDHSEPKVGSTVTASPPSVKIWFTEELEGAFSKIKVYDAKGTELDKKDSKVDSGNKALLTVSLPKLASGSYKVEWSVVSTDTHHTTGTFPFKVKGS